MPQHTDLNVSPYFDDFDPDKNYHKVLFKPGYPIQARELTTLQSILQHQVETFGKNIFKEGSVVIPGQTKYDNPVHCVQIESQYNGGPVSLYFDQLIGKRLKGSTSGVTAEVVYTLSDDESKKKNYTLYLRYHQSGGADLKNKTFISGETLTLQNSLSYDGIVLQVGQGVCNTITANAAGKGSLFSVAPGVYFVRGFFVNVTRQSVILEQYSTTPSYKVGFNIIESIITSDDDESLYDNAQGFSNYSAPGADRFKIELELAKKSLKDNDIQDFIEIFRVTDGTPQSYQKSSNYSLIRDEMARRLYDQSGDYYVKPFTLFVRDCLNDRVLNTGLFHADQKTMGNKTPAENLMIYEIGPGKAYVNGYEVETHASRLLDAQKTRTTNTLKHQVIGFNAGLLALVNNVYGSPTIGLGTGFTVSLMDSRVGSNPTVATGSTIGLARVYDYAPESAYSNDSSRLSLRLFDIQTYVNLVLTSPITLTTPAYIVGSRSNATGYLKSNVTNSTALTLYETSGSFLANESLIINGLPDGRLIYSVKDYNIKDIKSIYSNNGVSNAFTADLVLSSRNLIASPGTTFQITAGSVSGISTISAGLGTDFTNIVSVGDIITYSGTSTNLNSTYNKVVSVSAGGTNFTVSSIQSVAGVCNGSLPTSLTNVTNVAKLSASILSQDSSLVTKLKHSNLSSLNLEENEITQRRFYPNVAVSGNSLTISISDPDIYFDSFSSEKFLISYDDGTIETLTYDQYKLDTSGKQLQFIGLSYSGSGNADVIATVKNLKPNSKTKKFNTANTIVVNRSISPSSGIGGTTLNDGLAYSNIYGLRVQDENISLNVPDVVNVLAVYESNSTSDPSLPQLVCGSFTGKSNSTQDYVIGEQISGKTSGSVAIVVEIIDSATISYVYLNTFAFLENEVIISKKSKVQSKIIKKLNGDKNITQNFSLDDGQTEEFYDYSRIIRKHDVNAPNRKLKIVFQNYTIDASDTGEFVTVNSYPQSEFKHHVPFLANSRLTDYIDIRPRVAPYTLSSYSPFEYLSRNFSSDGQYSKYTLVPGENLILNYSYYLPRMDRVFLRPDGVFEIAQGTPSDNPKAPQTKSHCLDVARIHIPAYVYDVKNIVVEMAEHKRYTMRDISVLEDRIERVERFTTLNSLETKTENFKIKDAETGLDRFKCGFFVDNFSTTMYQDTQNSMFRTCIDTGTSTLRPTHYTTSVDLQLGSEAISGIGSTYSPNADHSYVTDLGSPGVKKSGDLITLDYKQVTYYEQLIATRSESITPFLVKYWQGSIELYPPLDTWFDEVSITVPSTVTNTVTAPPPPDTNVTLTDNVTVNHGVHTDPPTGASKGAAPFDWIANAKSVLSNYHQNQHSDWGGKSQGGLLQNSWNGELTSVSANNIHLVFVNQFFNKTGEDIINKLLPADVAAQYITKIKNGSKGLATTVINFTPPKETSTTTQSQSVSTTFAAQPPIIKESTSTSISHYTTPIKYLRSRNIEFEVTGLRPVTTFYPFFQGIEIKNYIIPKLLEIQMISGKFEIGEEVVSDTHFVSRRVAFRLCVPNHDHGPYDAPTDTFDYVPYTQQVFPTSYTESSTFLNVDTKSMHLPSETKYFGSVSIGMRLIGQTSKAVAEITNIRLASSNNGKLVGSIFIPDPNTVGNPKWINGTNTFMLSDTETLQETAPTDEIIPNTTITQSGASKDFHSVGTNNVTETDIVTTRNVTIIPPQKIVTTTITNTKTNTGTASASEFHGSSFDPLAESFFVTEKTGIYLTSVDIFFETKDDTVPVTLQIRPMMAGVPSNVIIPFSEVTLNPKRIGLSTNGSISTRFNFPSPVYLSGSTQQSIRQAPVANAQPKEYAVVLLSASPNHRVFITRLGEKDKLTGVQINSQPTLGSLFKSQDGATWTASQLEDLKFRLNRAEFVSEGLVRFFNPEFSFKNNKVHVTSANNFVSLSKTILVGLGSTGIDPNIGYGVTISQNSTATANLVGFAGSVRALSVINSGTGYTNGTFNNVSFITQTGYGLGAVGVVTVSSNKVTSASITNPGSGYQEGDSLLVPEIGQNLGFGAKVVVSSIGSTNTFVLSNVQGQFAVGLSTLNYTNNLGITTYVGVGVTISTITEDQYEDGLHMKIHHTNHGMHSPTNYVEISDFRPTDEEVYSRAASAITVGETNQILLNGTSGFETFEGLPVSASNPGYVIVGKELIKYNTVSTVGISSLVRGVDGTVSHPYPLNSANLGVPVYKYEFNGISIRRINKVHDFAQVANPVKHPIDLDHYYLKIDTGSTDFLGNSIGIDRTTTNNLFFKETKQHGLSGTKLSSNVQFETLTPKVQTILPSGTNIEASIRTTSATSIGGNEESFQDNGFQKIPLDHIITFNSPRMIASKVNENRFMSANPGSRSFSMQFYMTTTDTRLSPVIDTAHIHTILTSNRLNNPIGIQTGLTYSDDLKIRDLYRDPHSAIYISKPIKMNIPANSLKVLFTARRNNTNDLRVLFRLFRDDSAALSSNYELFPGYSNIQTDGLGIRRVIDLSKNDGSEDYYTKQTSKESFRDYEYTADDLPDFTAFSIKVIMSGTNQATPPILSDLRAIATVKPKA
jgi:hypothetical protein